MNTELSLRHVHDTPVTHDFFEGYGQDWDFVVATECEMCEKVTTNSFECEHCDADIYPDGPMMNYWYPCEIDDPTEAAKAIVDLPLCVVVIGFGPDATTGLALTGGGMDLSWEICAAYVALGYAPPVHFAHLPRFAGGSPHADIVVPAMVRSLTHVRDAADRDLARLLADHPIKETA